MKDNSLDGHRGKVALSDTTRNAASTSSNSNSSNSSSNSSSSVVVKCELKSPPAPASATANDGSAATNFDDDYNDYDDELGIGDLIIDLDADIEKTNERNGIVLQQPTTQHHHAHQQNGTTAAPNPSTAVNDSPTSAATFSFLGSQTPCNNNGNLAAAMSNSKSPRLSSNSGVSAGVTSSSGTGVATSGSSSSSNNNGASVQGSGAFEHQATVDKGLKMKIKRKTVGSKYSEAKHEIVQSDTKTAGASSHSVPDNSNSSNNSNNCASNSSSNSPANGSEAPKSKHSSSKGRNSSHREKKEKNRDKEKNSNARSNINTLNTPATSSCEMNGVLGVMSPLKISGSGVSLSSPAPPPLCSNSSPLPSSSVNTAVSTVSSVANSPASSNCGQENVQPSNGSLLNIPIQPAATNSPPMPNLTLKLETKFTPSPIPQPCPNALVVIKQEEEPLSPPQKKIKLEPSEQNGELDCPDSPNPEMKDASTCISVGTITEPDCLGPCEPGTSVMLEGIVWQETEGGVLVVNVTWRGKTYVGTLLDCTKHDWAPPRFCESPTSDVDSKTSKGRGKRGRGGNNSSSDLNFADARNCVQSKLRNGKGRRTTINSNASNSGFTVPNSPAKSDSGSSNGKRKGRPADLEITSTPTTNDSNSNSKSSKRSRNQNRATPTSSSAEFSQPSSPVLIVCPEPNCNKKYKHINGLRYHQTHAHSTSDSSKMDDTATEDSKDVTNSSDNEESMQESTSVSTSPAPTFANAVPAHSATGKLLLNETTSSSSSNLNRLPDADPFNLNADLSTLASVAINDSKTDQKANDSRTMPGTLHSPVSQDLPATTEGDTTVPSLSVSISSPNASVSSPLLPVASESPPVSGTGLSASVSAVTTSVIQSSSSVDSTPSISQAVTVSIPTTHVIFNQGMSGSNSTNVSYTASSVVCNNSLSPSRNMSVANVTTTFAQVSSIVSPSATSPSSMLPMIDKNKIKQERPDKYKPKSPLSSSAIRPLVPAPTQLLALSPGIPPHPGMDVNNLGVVGSPLKPIQPKPTILGESSVNPSLDSLKKDKSKHKKKSKDKDKERDKKLPSLPLTPTKLGMNPTEECEAMELTSYPPLEAVSGSTAPLPGAPHSTLSPLVSQPKPPETSLDMSLADDSINENIQSPAYSDISDANDTAPVLESEVPSGKDKEDKVGKTTPDASQSPAANISAYGMYPYYSQPPYLLPSVSPQSAVSVSGTQGPNLNEKNDVTKKVDQERVKENRPWSNPSVESRDRQHIEHHDSEKKANREEIVHNPGSISSPAGVPGPVQDYSLPQHYAYPYGYVQGYPYAIEPSPYQMHMLENDPHYKQQYKQYIEDQQRLYKEQQHHHQQQQLQQMQQQQQQQQQQQHHHQQQQHHHQQQQQQQQHQSHHGHHSHQSHHQSKSQHHSSMKEDRDRSRESKERSSNVEKMPGSGLIVEHSSKIQHSSMSMVSNKDHDIREIETRPPSLPAQTRIDSSAPSSASAAALKEKQNENHQILKENIELKSQMDDSKNKINQYEMAMIYERHKEDMRRYFMYQDRVIEQQQQKMEPGIHHHSHLHQTVQSHSHIQSSSSSYSSSSSLKPHKDELSGSISSHSKSNHYGDSTRSSVVSPAKSDHIKNSHTNSTSSPKGNIRDSSMGNSKEYVSSISSRESSSSKKDSQSKSSERSESSSREEKKSEKIKVEPKVESEGQKPTMETTGPPPPPTNSYAAYFHPSAYIQGPPHFPHMPMEPAHAMYRGGINPMIVSAAPHYGSSPYVHPQIRYVTPGACELPAHAQPPDALGGKLHPSGPSKALDLLHQVSQHYTTTHKIHELQEHALMSPTPTSTPSSTPSTVSSSGSGKSSTEPVVVASKMEGPRDTSRSPPTQRHIHQHHHTHVGVGYPIYDPYGAIIPSPAPAVDCKPIHPLQVKPPAAGARFWPH